MLRVGLLGAGFIGKIHADAWRHVPGAKVVAVAGAAGAETLAASWGAQATMDVESVIGAADVDVIDICLPTPLHEPCAISALRAGKHVICEKPLALSVASADRIFAAAQAADRVIMAAQVVRFWPEYLAAAKLVQSGTLGKMRALRASRTSVRPTWGGWFADPAQSGGALFDLLGHDVDYVVSLLGTPQRVHALGVRSQAGAWDHVSSHLDFGHTGATIEASYLMPAGYPFTTTFQILCEQGLLEHSFRAPGNVASRSLVTGELTLTQDGQTVACAVPVEDGYVSELRHFTECVTARRPSELVPNAQVRTVLAVLETLRRSLETGEALCLA